MKKSFLTVLALICVCTSAFASPQSDAEAHRKEVKAIKDAQRAARLSEKKDGTAKAAPGFWDKEAERSGFSRMGHPGDVLQNLNPMPFFKSEQEKYRARKSAENKR